MNSGYCNIHSKRGRASELGRLGGLQNRHVRLEPGTERVEAPHTAEEVRRLLAETLAGVQAGTVDPKVGTAVAYIANPLLKSLDGLDLRLAEESRNIFQGRSIEENVFFSQKGYFPDDATQKGLQRSAPGGRGSSSNAAAVAATARQRLIDRAKTEGDRRILANGRSETAFWRHVQAQSPHLTTTCAGLIGGGYEAEISLISPKGQAQKIDTSNPQARMR